MASLRFRAPGSALTLGEVLERALGVVAELTLERGLASGRARVHVEGAPGRDLRARVAPAARIEVAGFERRLAEPHFIGVGEGADWLLLRRVAPPFGDTLDRLSREPLLRVLPDDPELEGLWLFARGVAASARCANEARAHPAGLGYRGLAPAPAWRRGEIGGRTGFRWAALRPDGLADLVLHAPDSGALRRDLAAAAMPLVGDLRLGGALGDGALRLGLAELELPALGIAAAVEAAWPELPEPWCAPAPRLDAPGGERNAEPPELRVSAATLRALSRGHPWVLRDRETGDTGRFRPGAVVALRGREGRQGGLACVEDGGRVAARAWSPGAARLRDAASPEERVARALARREALFSAADTDAFRLVHGEADGLPGLHVDRFGSVLRALVTARACEGFLARALGSLASAFEKRVGRPPCVVEVVHLRDTPPGRFECVRLRDALAPPPPEPLWVRERGLELRVDLGLAHAERGTQSVGLFLDQRENRARLARRAERGGRFLNLFAHTGAFSAALLAAGAASVISVDASPTWLRWLDQNLARNRIDPARHRSLRGDGRRALDRLEGRFDGIVIDPPTAATAAHSRWSVRRDLRPLVARALRGLAPGGALLVCRNDRQARGSLADLVRHEVREAGRPLASLSPAPAGSDFPSLRGFPEGNPFEGVLAELG
jgi:23S rRNA (cytosine1962-C5)-methyltransferase